MPHLTQKKLPNMPWSDKASLSRRPVPGRRGEWLLSSQATFVGFEMTTAELDWHTDKGWKDGVRKAAAFAGV